MRRRRTAEERLAVVMLYEQAPPGSKMAVLERAGVAWATYVTWRERFRRGGVEALADRARGRPQEGLGARLDALEARVTALEAARDPD